MSLIDRVRAAMNAFATYSDEPVVSYHDRYNDRWAWWDGSWRADPQITALRLQDPRLYANTRQLWRTADAIVSLYEQFVYAGDLPAEGKEIDETVAIPIDPHAGGQRANDTLRDAIATLWDVWRWRQHMTMRPKFGAILGDCLTELVDDLDKGFVYPKTVWPGRVKDISLNLVGDVERYTLEWRVEVPQSTAYGVTTQAESYLFRKEVDSKFFRFYKNDQPSDGLWGRAVQPNPYGFVPAIWDRHEIVFGPRGLGALDRTLRTAKEINSVLSHAIDYQAKKFSAPIGVVGARAPRRGATMLRTTQTPDSSSETNEDPMGLATRMGLMPMTDTGKFVTIDFDVGKTVEMLQLLIEAAIAESPESRYGQQLLDMSQVTGPAVELILAPIVGKVKRARANYDPQTIKLIQMSISIISYRLQNNHYSSILIENRSARYKPFMTYTIDSYHKGALDAVIEDRPVFPESQLDRILRVIQTQGIKEPYFLKLAGLDDAEIAEIDKQRKARRDEETERQQLAFNRGDFAPTEEE